jgi:hypothetical protein
MSKRSISTQGKAQLTQNKNKKSNNVKSSNNQDVFAPVFAVTESNYYDSKDDYENLRYNDEWIINNVTIFFNKQDALEFLRNRDAFCQDGEMFQNANVFYTFRGYREINDLQEDEMVDFQQQFMNTFESKSQTFIAQIKQHLFDVYHLQTVSNKQSVICGKSCADIEDVVYLRAPIDINETFTTQIFPFRLGYEVEDFFYHTEDMTETEKKSVFFGKGKGKMSYENTIKCLMKEHANYQQIQQLRKCLNDDESDDETEEENDENDDKNKVQKEEGKAPKKCVVIKLGNKKHVYSDEQFIKLATEKETILNQMFQSGNCQVEVYSLLASVNDVLCGITFDEFRGVRAKYQVQDVFIKNVSMLPDFVNYTIGLVTGNNSCDKSFVVKDILAVI